MVMQHRILSNFMSLKRRFLFSAYFNNFNLNLTKNKVDSIYCEFLLAAEKLSMN